jgi:hypothetical protein
LPGFTSLGEGGHTIYFQASDDAGFFCGQSGEWGWQFYRDTLPPSDPSVIDASPGVGIWSSDNTVEISWTGATDAISGLDGYSILWNTSPDTIPDHNKDLEESITNTTSPALADGDSHYFHISSVDNAGNWQSTLHIGPFYVDTVPPGAVIDLAAGTATQTSVQLSWTAPGNNNYEGIASLYDIRYSTANITGANWDSAIRCTGEPKPSANGSAEVFTITSLSSGTTYYFALKTADDASNYAAISNIASKATLSGGGVVSSGGGGGGGGGGSSQTTNLVDFMTGDGKFISEVTAESSDGLVKIRIPGGTVARSRTGQRLRYVTIKNKPAPSDLAAECEYLCLVYDIGPIGANFDPLAYLIFKYGDADVPEGVAEENLVLATWQDGVWVELDGCVVDSDNNTITAPVTHLSVFTAMAHTAPARFEVTGITATPAAVQPDEPTTISVIVTNAGDLTEAFTVVLKTNDTDEQNKTVTLKGGESQKVSFIVTQGTAGEYSVSIGDLSGKFTVIEPGPEGEAIEVPVPEPPSPSPTPTEQPIETLVTPTQPGAKPEPSVQHIIKPTPSGGISWWLIAIYVVVGLILVGGGAYYFRKKRSF